MLREDYASFAKEQIADLETLVSALKRDLEGQSLYADDSGKDFTMRIEYKAGLIENAAYAIKETARVCGAAGFFTD